MSGPQGASTSNATDGLRFNPGGSRNLDVLRMIAVTLVVQDHLFTFWGNPTYLGFIVPLRLGRFGVILFFVHTALVLMASMERQWKKTGRHRFISIFLIRRGFRIFPLAVTALVVTVLFNIPGQSDVHRLSHVRYGAKTLVANLALVQNVAGGANTSILSPMWSLAFEWQMYLVLPFLYFIGRRASTIVPMLVIWAIPELLLLSYGAQVDQFNRTHAFWKIPDWGTYGPCFLAGVVAFLITEKMEPAPVLPWLALPLAIAAMFVPVMATSQFSKFVPAALIVALIIPYCREIRRGWFSEFARIVVRYSYGVYLFHLIGIWIAFVRLKHEPLAIQWLVFAALVVTIPVAAYHLVERPAIVLGNRIAVRLEPPVSNS